MARKNRVSSSLFPLLTCSFANQPPSLHPLNPTRSYKIVWKLRGRSDMYPGKHFRWLHCWHRVATLADLSRRHWIKRFPLIITHAPPTTNQHMRTSTGYNIVSDSWTVFSTTIIILIWYFHFFRTFVHLRWWLVFFFSLRFVKLLVQI